MGLYAEDPGFAGVLKQHTTGQGHRTRQLSSIRSKTKARRRAHSNREYDTRSNQVARSQGPCVLGVRCMRPRQSVRVLRQAGKVDEQSSRMDVDCNFDERRHGYGTDVSLYRPGAPRARAIIVLGMHVCFMYVEALYSPILRYREVRTSRRKRQLRVPIAQHR